MSNERKRVADLPSDCTVHYKARVNGADTAVHTERDCRHIADEESVFSHPAGHLTQNRPVCQECTGTIEFGPDSGTDVNATRKKLQAMDLEDAGLSPAGDRSTASNHAREGDDA